MAFLGGIGSLLSGVFSAVGAIASANAQAAAANYNAQVQEQQARVALDQGAAAAGQEARRTRQRIAAAETAGLESGLTLSGSTGAVINQARDEGNFNTLLAMYDGSMRATGHKNNAQLDRMNARSSRVAGFIGAGSSLLGGVSGFYRSSQLSV